MATPSRPAPVVLLVLDGWGYRAEREGNAIALANVPTWDGLWARAPRTLLDGVGASGRPAGGPDGQQRGRPPEPRRRPRGDAGPRPHQRRRSRTAASSRTRVLVDACRRVKATGGTLHLVGLIGAGGVHAIDTHLFALLDLAEREQVPRVAIHAMLDGRDTMPRSGLGYMRGADRRRAKGRAVDRRASAAATTAWIATSAGTARRSGTTRGARRRARARRIPLAGRFATRTSADETDEFIDADGDRRRERRSPSRRCATATR